MKKTKIQSDIKKRKVEDELAECKKSNDQLRESLERMTAIFNSTRDGIAVLDKTGKIISINKSLVEIGGYSEKDIVGKRIAVLKMFTPKSLAKIMAAFIKRMAGGVIPPYEVEAKMKNGKKKQIEIHGSLLKIRGKIIGDVAVLRDITDRKKTGAELEKKNEELEKFIKLSVGREMRIIELKGKIKELEDKLRETEKRS